MKYVIQDTTLTAIGDAIREKGGTTDLIPVVDLADAITNLPSGGGGEPLEQKYQITTGSSFFRDGNMAWLMDDYFKDAVELNIVDKACDYMFYSAKLTDEQWANIHRAKCLAPLNNMEYMFQYSNVKKVPFTKFTLVSGSYQPKLRYMFEEANQLEEIDDEVGALMAAGFNEAKANNRTNTHMANIFNYATKLRYISPILLKSWTGMQFSRDYQNTFSGCHSLRKLEGLGVTVAPYFSGFIGYNTMLSKLTFDVQEDGSPYAVTNSAWGGTTISFTNVGYWGSYSDPSPIANYQIDYDYRLSNLKATGTNSMLFNYDTTTDFINGQTIFSISEAEMRNGNGSYDELLDNWWYTDRRYSRYGARELAETLLSLPDKSAVSGTSTISISGTQASCVRVLKQKGNAVSILNTVSDVATNYPDAVAAATAKGWTLSFT